MANDLDFKLGFIADPTSARQIRQVIERQLQGIGVSVDTGPLKKVLGTLESGLSGSNTGKASATESALSQLTSSIKFVNDAINRQKQILDISVSAQQNAQKALDSLTRSVSADENQINAALAKEKQFQKEIDESNSALNSLQKEAIELQRALSALQRIVPAILQRQDKASKPSLAGAGLDPGQIVLPSQGLAEDIQLTSKDKKALRRTFKGIDELKNVIFDATGAFREFVPGVRGGKGAFIRLDAEQEKLANQIKSNFLQEKLLAQQQASIVAKDKEQASLRQEAQNELRKAIAKASADTAKRAATKIEQIVGRAFGVADSAEEQARKQASDAQKSLAKARQDVANATKIAAKAELDGVRDKDAFRRNERDFVISQLKEQQQQKEQQAKKDKKTAEELARLQADVSNKKGADALKRFKEDQKLDEQIFVKQVELNKKIARIREQRAQAEAELLANINRRLAEEGVKFSKGVIGGGGGQAQVGRGGIGGGAAGDLAKIATKDQQKFIKVLLEQEDALQKAGRAFKNHHGNIAKGNSIIDRYTASLDSGRKAAFQFGFAASDAAARLLAWSAPASFLFGAISALKDASRSLVQLDSVARRLAFFQAGDTISNSFANVTDVTNKMRASVSANLNAIIKEAQKTGLSIKDISGAVTTIQKIGTKAFSGGEATPFLKAVEGLIRIEKGAINAERATEILAATLRQVSSSEEDFQQKTRDAERFAALFAKTAGDTSFGVDDLGTVLNGILPSFQALGGIGFEESLKLASIAASKLGTNASRTRTALRQLPTLAIKFAKQIEASSGIQIIDEKGNLKGFNAIITALKEIKKLKGSVGGFKLTDFFAEAENVADLITIADSVDDIEKSLTNLRASGKESADAVTFFFAGSQLQSESLESSINRLDTAFVSLLKDANLADVLRAGADSGAALTQTLNGIINSIKTASGEISTLGKGLAIFAGGIALSKVSKTIGAFGAGLTKGFIGLQLAEESRQILTAGSRKEASTLQQVDVARREGIISAKDGVKLEKEAFTLALREKSVVEQLNVERNVLKTLKASEVASVKEIRNQEVLVNNLLNERNKILKEDLVIRNKIGSATNKFFQGGVLQTLSRNATAIFSGAILAGGLIGSQGIAKLFSKDSATAKQISGGIESAITGAIVGFSAAGPIGAAAGATAGLTLFSFKNLEESKKSINEAAAGVLDAAKAAQAANQQLQAIDKLEKERLKRIDEQDKANRELLSVNAQLERNQVKLVQLNKISTGTAEEKAQISKLEAENIDLILRRETLVLQVGDRQLATTKRRLELEERLLGITGKQERFTRSISLVQEAQVALLELNKSNPLEIQNVKIDFDKRQLDNRIDFAKEKIANIDVAIKELGQVGDQQDTIRNLTKQRQELKNFLLDANAEAVQLEFNSKKELLKLATDAANKQIDAWKTASQEVADAFAGLFDANLANISSLGEKLNAQLEQINLARFADDVSTEVSSGLIDAVKEAKKAAARVTAATQGTDLTRQFIQSAQSALQFNFAGSDASVSQGLDARVDELRKAIQAGGENPNPFQQLDIANAKNSLEEFKRSIDQDKRSLAESIKLENELIKATKEEIDARKDTIKVLKDALSQEAERGKNLLNNTSEVISGIRKILGAQASGAFNNLGGSRDEVAENLAKNLNRIRQQPGGLANQRVLGQAVEAAVERGIKLNPLFSPTEFKDLFFALSNTGDANLAKENLKQQQTEQGKIEALLKNNEESGKAILAATISQVQLSNQNSALLEAQRDIAQSALSVASENLAFSKENIKTIEDAVKGLAQEIVTTLGSSIETFGAQEYFRGVDGIIKAITDSARIISGQNIPAPEPFSAPTGKESVLRFAQNDKLGLLASIEQEQTNAKLTESIEKFNTISLDLKNTIGGFTVKLNELNTSNKTVIESKVAPVEISENSIANFNDEFKTVITGQMQNIMSNFITGLNPILESLDKGIKIADSNLNVTIAADIKQQISASKDLEAVLLRLAGGDRQEMERLKEIMVKSIAREVERDATKVSVNELDFIGSFGAARPR